MDRLSSDLSWLSLSRKPCAFVDGTTLALVDERDLVDRYDHRLLDGREAVTFLVRIKEYIEDPRRML